MQKTVIQDIWPFQSHHYAIFKDETYYLVQDDKKECFDISIENYNGENDFPALKLLISCKKTTIGISKDELILFERKVNDISGCCKAIVISNSSFHEDALQYAQKKGIGLLRVFDDDKIKWLAPRKLQNKTTNKTIEKSNLEIEKALCQSDYSILNNFIVGYSDSFFSNLSCFLNSFNSKEKLPYVENSDLLCTKNISTNEDFKQYTNEELRAIANHVRSNIYGNSHSQVKKVKTDDLINYIEDKFHFTTHFYKNELYTTSNDKIDALVDYERKEIMIYNTDNTNSHLIKFSIAHELSHLILHSDLLEDGKSNFFFFYKSKKESHNIETQANKLANYLILSDDILPIEFMRIANDLSLNPKNGHYLYLDNQKCNRDLFRQVSDILSNLFDVSREQIKIRLSEHGWLMESEKQSPLLETLSSIQENLLRR